MRNETKRYALRGCPKCAGDLRREDDTFGSYEQCVQCGYLHEVPGKPPVALPAAS
jgi:hypothetical protein